MVNGKVNATNQNINDEEMTEIFPDDLKTKNGCMPALLALIAVLITIIGGIWLLGTVIEWIGGTF